MNKLNYIISNFSIFNTIKHINHGGCGIFAENLYNALKKLNLKPKLILLTTNVEEANNVIKTNSNNLPYGMYVHIMVYVKGKYYIDINGFKHQDVIDESYFDKKPVYRTELPVDLLREWNKIEDNWNPEFNRKNELKIVRRMNKIINNYKKEYLVN